MDSPNRIANIISGMNETIGVLSLAPSRDAPQPHWNTATTTP